MTHRPTLALFVPLLLTCLLPAPLTSQSKGTKEFTIKVDDKERGYILHVPSKYQSKGRKKVALVLMLHGRGSSGKQASSSYYGWTKMANKEGFIAAFPDAIGKPTSWKPAWGRSSTEDGAFLSALIDKLLKEYRIDPKKVFMTGHSSGGIMSFSFAATHSSKVAAIGPVAGSIGYGRATIPKPKGPVRVISFHGMADKIVAYDKNTKSAYPGMVSAPDSAAFWAKANGCSQEPKRKDIKSRKVHIDSWNDCKPGGEVVFYSIEKGSHGWPTGSLKATELIWEFFEETSLIPGKKTSELEELIEAEEGQSRRPDKDRTPSPSPR
ncbi:MAG: PHB depolymerase family esterase [Planctomycetota bacterium]|jgi:polyhydroxybutyrate depolymerase|nr:PHB depolymerase family esterase [Planctomycetota bacterium]